MPLCFKRKIFIPIETLLTILCANSADNNFGDIFLYFLQNTGCDSSCKLSLLENIRINCQILFSGKNKQKYVKMSSAENFTRSAKR